MTCFRTWHRPCNRDCRNQTIPMKTQSTYSLLVKSQETGRSIFETAVNALVVLSTVVAMFQFASQAVVVPTIAKADTTSPALVAKADTTATNARG